MKFYSYGCKPKEDKEETNNALGTFNIKIRVKITNREYKYKINFKSNQLK